MTPLFDTAPLVRALASEEPDVTWRLRVRETDPLNLMVTCIGEDPHFQVVRFYLSPGRADAEFSQWRAVCGSVREIETWQSVTHDLELVRRCKADGMTHHIAAAWIDAADASRWSVDVEEAESW